MLAGLFDRPYKKAITARLNGSSPHRQVPDGGRTEQIFIVAMFALMGRIAKLDGRVTQGEVSDASTTMTLMGLGAHQRREAINYFEQGKLPNTDVIQCVFLLMKKIRPRSVLASLFLKIQIRNSFVKGNMRLKEKVLLRDIADILGYDKGEFLNFCGELQGRIDTKGSRARNFPNNAYQVLQLEPGAADGEIRRAYLRLMSRYHPDKLVRDDLSEDSLKQAQEKSMAIRTAYETVCGFRKIKV